MYHHNFSLGWPQLFGPECGCLGDHFLAHHWHAFGPLNWALRSTFQHLLFRVHALFHILFSTTASITFPVPTQRHQARDRQSLLCSGVWPAWLAFATSSSTSRPTPKLRSRPTISDLFPEYGAARYSLLLLLSLTTIVPCSPNGRRKMRDRFQQYAIVNVPSRHGQPRLADKNKKYQKNNDMTI